MTTYNAAPLPFQGQKRFFLRAFRAALAHFPDEAIYVDLFGGSGLLSHTVRAVKTRARVIWNDYDNYQRRLDLIPRTNELRQKLEELLKGEGSKAKINHRKTEIATLLGHYPTEQLDCLTLSANLLFSGNYANTIEELLTQGMYNRVRSTPYDAHDYLMDVERRSQDYRELIAEFAPMKPVVFIFDPPYLGTDVSSYHKANYWTLRDYLDVIKHLAGRPYYFYFGSNRSHLIDLLDFLAMEMNFGSPLAGATRETVNNRVNYGSSYQDIMLYKYL